MSPVLQHDRQVAHGLGEPAPDSSSPALQDAAGVSHPQGVTTDAQSQQQQQQPQPQPGQPQQFMPQAMQHMPHQYPGAMPGGEPQLSDRKA